MVLGLYLLHRLTVHFRFSREQFIYVQCTDIKHHFSPISDIEIGLSCPFASLAQTQDWVSWATVSELANSPGLIFAVEH